MGLNIGNSENPTPVNFVGDLQPQINAYMRLTGEYHYLELNEKLTCSIAIYRAKETDEATPCKDIEQATKIDLDVTIEEFSQTPTPTLIQSKITSRLEEIVPTWKDKIFPDFD